MKTILYMATSMTGKTTSGADDTSWVEPADIERMDAEMIRCGVMIMGRATYDSFGDELPINKALLVIMTHDQSLLAHKQDGLIFTDASPREVLTMLEEKGYQSALLAGGEKINSAFLEAGLIDEVRIILKPLIIGKGKSLFDTPIDRRVKLSSCTPLPDGSIEISYTART